MVPANKRAFLGSPKTRCLVFMRHKERPAWSGKDMAGIWRASELKVLYPTSMLFYRKLGL